MSLIIDKNPDLCIEKCDHVVGQISNKAVCLTQWDQAVKDFGRVVDDFNIRGQIDQIDHPGWCMEFKFCTLCGCDLSAMGLSLAKLTWTDRPKIISINQGNIPDTQLIS